MNNQETNNLVKKSKVAKKSLECADARLEEESLSNIINQCHNEIDNLNGKFSNRKINKKDLLLAMCGFAAGITLLNINLPAYAIPYAIVTGMLSILATGTYFVIAGIPYVGGKIKNAMLLMEINKLKAYVDEKEILLVETKKNIETMEKELETLDQQIISDTYKSVENVDTIEDHSFDLVVEDEVSERKKGKGRILRR